MQGPGKIDIVRIQPCHYVSGGAGEPCVDGIVHAFIRLAYIVGQGVTVLLNDRLCPIRRSSVYDDIFQVVVMLGKNGTDGLFDVIRHIVTDGDNADPKRVHKDCLQSLGNKKWVKLEMKVPMAGIQP